MNGVFSFAWAVACSLLITIGGWTPVTLGIAAYCALVSIFFAIQAGRR